MGTNSIFVGLACILSLASGCQTAKTPMVAMTNRVTASAVGEHAAHSETDFAFATYSKMKKAGNFFFSPYSLWEALAMTYAGANGATKTQMARALQLSAGDGNIHSDVHQLEQRFRESGIQSDGFTLRIVNGFWAEQSYKFLDPFTETLQDYYGVEVHPLDFRMQAEPGRQAINSSVQQATNDKIKDLLPRGSVNSLTKLVLTNAIYLKGKWSNAFDKEKTRPEDFESDQGVVQAQMMRKLDKYRIAATDDYIAVEMPYVGDKFAMVAILPKNELSTLEARLSSQLLQEIRGGLQEQKIALSFPKFKVESSSEPVEALKKMGMRDAFTDNADFSLMDGTRELFISDVLHKAFIQVDEEGTEAAAATAVVIQTRSMVMVKEVKFNRPFLSLIWHRETGAVLFMGRVTNPLF